ncbi:MAG: PfkB family carbohydrate kinase [Halioglobus sp.]
MTDGAALYVFGEVLFDEFPDGNRLLGGAPFNVAWHLQALGESPRLVSRVGDDARGDQVRAAMADWGLDTGFLQTDPRRPTGRVAVTITDGEPAYNIVPDCAYDHIETVSLPPGGLLYHGSLAARADASADTLRQLRAAGPRQVFIDVNLRPPWWRRAAVLQWLQGAHWVKLNSAELALLADATPSQDTGRAFLRRHQLQDCSSRRERRVRNCCWPGAIACRSRRCPASKLRTRLAPVMPLRQ